MTTTSDTTDDTKPTHPRRRSLFDLLDKLRPKPAELPRRRPAREIALGPERRPPAPTARDRAAEERMRRPFG